MVTPRLLIVALLLIHAGPRHSFAQASPPFAPDTLTAAQHRDHAAGLEAKYDYAGAITEYRAAYLLDKTAHPEVAASDLRNTGLAYDYLSQYAKALNYYRQALPLYRRGGDRDGEAKDLMDAGNACDELSQPVKALTYYGQALPIFRQIGNRDGEASDLTNMGLAYDHLSQYAKALDYYGQALPIFRQAGNRDGEASDLMNTGSAYLSLSRPQKAIDFFGQALPIFQQAGDRDGEAKALTSMGSAYLILSQYAKALDYYGQALPIFQQAGDKDSEAGGLTNMGLAYDHLSQYAKALDYYGQALTLYRQAGDRDGEANALMNTGGACLSLSQYAKAIEFYRQALPIFRQAGDRDGEASDLMDTGLAYRDLNQPQKAIDCYQQALPIFRQAGDRDGEAGDLDNTGIVYDERGQHAKAVAFYGQALPIFRQAGDRDGEANALTNTGSAYLSLSQYAQATVFFGQALLIFQQAGNRAGEAKDLSNLMLSWQARKLPRLAVFYGKQAVNFYQSIRTGLQALNRQIQQTYLGSVAGTYHTLAALLIGQGRLPEAEQVLHLLKDQEFQEFVRRDPATLPPTQQTLPYDATEQAQTDTFRTLADPVTTLGAQIDALKRNRDRTPEQDKTLDELEANLTPAEEKFQAFLAALPQELADASGDTKARVQQVHDAEGPLQRQLRTLGPGTVALFTLLEPDRYRVIVVTSQIEKAEEYPIKADALRAKLLAWREALSDPRADPRPLGKQLYDILIGPVEKDLAGAQATTLMWSLDDVLRYVPVAALYDGRQYLVERYQTEVFTGASLPALSQSPVDWTVLALGVSQPHQVTLPGQAALSFPALPGVPQEIGGIVRDDAHPNGALPGKSLLDGDFTQSALRTGLNHGYPVVHIASHFAFGKDYASSFLLLGDGTALTLDQFNGSGQVFQDVDLLTLSACQTGLGGRMGDGHEVESFGMLAQSKGASSILATLWPVADASTRALMDGFYQRHGTGGGVSKAAALRGVQLDLLHGTVKPSDPAILLLDPKASYRHPYYWAPFVLIGNWK